MLINLKKLISFSFFFLSQEARVIKGNGPMGLSIVGGSDQACPPFGIEQRGVFVSKVRN